MSRVRYISPDSSIQSWLDKANEWYYAVCLEENYFQYADPEKVYAALMAAWDYIGMVTKQEEVNG